MTQRTLNLPLAITATVVLTVCGVLAFANQGSVLYEDSATGRSVPKKTAAGYLATADGGVVAVLNSAKPTAVNQALRSITPGTAATAGFVSDPAATTTTPGVVRLDPNTPQPDGIAAPGNGGMC